MHPPEDSSQVTPKTVWVVGLNALAIAVAVFVIYQTRMVLTWIVVSLLLAVALDPPVSWLERRGFRRGLAVLAVVAVAAAIVAGVGAAIVPVLVRQGQSLVAAAPGMIENLRDHRIFEWAQERFGLIETAKQELAENAAAAASQMFRILGGIFTSIVATITIVVLTVFMLVYGDRLLHTGLEWVEPSKRPRLVTLLGRIRRSIAGYVIGTLVIALIGGVVTGTVLAILGVPYFVPLGLAMMVLAIVPYVGTTIGAVLVVGTTFLTSGTRTGLIALGIFVGYQQLENELLQPLVQRKTIKMSPLLIAIAMLVGTALAGIVGALLALPIAGAIQVVLEDVLERRKERWAGPERP